MAILVLFEQFSGKFCLCFWPLILSASPTFPLGSAPAGRLTIFFALRSHQTKLGYGNVLYQHGIIVFSESRFTAVILAPTIRPTLSTCPIYVGLKQGWESIPKKVKK